MRTLLGSLVVAMMACTSHEPAPAGPRLSRVRAVTLDEDNRTSFGEYLTFDVAPSGRLAISDMTAHRVTLLEPDGGVIRHVGSRGAGPGELDGPRTVHFDPDERTITVIDMGHRRLSTFGTADGALVEATRVAVGDVGANWIPQSDAIWFGLWGADSAIGRWRRRDGQLAQFSALPDAMRRDPYTALSHGKAELLPDADRWLVLVPTEPDLWVTDQSGQLLERVRIPRVHRRGPTADLFARAARRHAARGADRFEPAGSAVAGLGRLSDSTLVLLYLDGDQVIAAPSQPGTPVFGNFRLWVTLLRPDRSAACVDGRVPIESELLPTARVVGDSLRVLYRDFDADSEPRTQLATIAIDSSTCQWIPTERLLARARSSERSAR